MEYIGELQHRLVSLLVQICSSYVLVIKVSNMVEFLLDGINKIFPIRFYILYFVLIFGMSITVIVLSIFDTEEGLKESEGDIFVVGNFFNR